MTNTSELITPVDGSVYAERPVAGRAEIDAVLAKARAAQKDWAARPLAERVVLVRAGIAKLRDMNDEIVPEIAWQMGRPVRYGGEIGGVEERAYHMADIAGEAEIGAVHAGLECGIIGEKYPEMDMISFGPQIDFPHSPDERVKVASVKEFYEVLTATLEELARE